MKQDKKIRSDMQLINRISGKSVHAHT